MGHDGLECVRHAFERALRERERLDCLRRSPGPPTPGPRAPRGRTKCRPVRAATNATRRAPGWCHRTRAHRRPTRPPRRPLPRPRGAMSSASRSSDGSCPTGTARPIEVAATDLEERCAPQETRTIDDPGRRGLRACPRGPCRRWAPARGVDIGIGGASNRRQSSPRSGCDWCHIVAAKLDAGDVVRCGPAVITRVS